MTTLDPLTKSPNLAGQRLERAAWRMGELWERCQGKGWPDAESYEFTELRDERMPALRAELRASLAVATDEEPGYTEDEIGAATAEVGLPDSICERLLIALQDARAKG